MVGWKLNLLLDQILSFGSPMHVGLGCVICSSPFPLWIRAMDSRESSQGTVSHPPWAHQVTMLPGSVDNWSRGARGLPACCLAVCVAGWRSCRDGHQWIPSIVDLLSCVQVGQFLWQTLRKLVVRHRLHRYQVGEGRFACVCPQCGATKAEQVGELLCSSRLPSNCSAGTWRWQCPNENWGLPVKGCLFFLKNPRVFKC